MPAFLENIAPFLGTGKDNEQGQSLEEFLKEYDPYKYKNPCVTTDAVVFSYERKPVKESNWKILMIQRGNHPCIGWWALPGGFINLNENLDDTAKRELEEETGVKGLPMEQFAVYGNVDRDPRARVVTSAYMAIVDAANIIVKAGDDAADALWYEVFCRTETVEEINEAEAGEKMTDSEEDRMKCRIHHLELYSRERDIRLTAKVEERFREGLIREQKFRVLDSDMIACDHAAIIVQAWKLLKSRI